VLRFLTAGESHGQALVVIVECLPAGLAVTVEDLANDLARRRLGYGRGPRMRFEQDELTILAGVRHGRTLGSPVAVQIGNAEWNRGKWNEEMSPAPGATTAPLTKVRPGHADLAGMQKYGLDDARDVLERASARETAARVVAGTLARLLVRHIGVEIVSHVVRIGEVAAPDDGWRPGPEDLATVDASPVRCGDAGVAEAMAAAIKAAAADGDSLGGVAEVIAYGVPVGLGSHVHWDRKLDGLLAQALMSIHAVKAVEIGDGLAVAARRGSVAHDAITFDRDAPAYRRSTDRAGGLEGGITNGAPLIARVAMKPLSTLNRPVLATVDTATNTEAVSFRERTDVTAVPALGVVAEAMVAVTLASEVLRKFGGDSVTEMVRNAEAFAEQVRRQVLDAPGAPAEVELNWDERLAFADSEAAPAASGDATDGS
jgi:chorismate synthase